MKANEMRTIMHLKLDVNGRSFVLSSVSLKTNFKSFALLKVPKQLLLVNY